VAAGRLAAEDGQKVGIELPIGIAHGVDGDERALEIGRASRVT
jgi:hypothetical protein